MIRLAEETHSKIKIADSGVFCTVDFYDFETQSTRVVRDKKVNFNLTIQFPVVVDDAFLDYMHKVRCFSFRFILVL